MCAFAKISAVWDKRCDKRKCACVRQFYIFLKVTLTIKKVSVEKNTKSRKKTKSGVEFPWKSKAGREREIWKRDRSDKLKYLDTEGYPYASMYALGICHCKQFNKQRFILVIR